ncbi:MAG: methyltransferase domain-containing protein [Actinomycetota bacterium]
MAYTLKVGEAEIDRYRRMAESARRLEADSWTLAGIVPGARVADVGCGPGLPLCEMAKAVAPGGEATGVEREPGTMATATAILEREGITNARVITGDAGATGLEPGNFDAVMMRHVLAHNGGREQEIVDHLATLVKPGGYVYLVDVDATAIRAVPSSPEFEELTTRYIELHEELGNDLSIGLKLPILLDAAGLEVVERRGVYDSLERSPEMRGPAWAARETLIERGFATEADFARWEKAIQRDAEAPGLKLIYFPVLWAIGRRSAE